MTSPFSIYRGLPRAVWVLFVAQIVNSLGNFVYPFLALLLTRTVGMNAADAGRFIMLAGLSFAPGSLLGGRIADSLGRKRVIVVGFLIVAASFSICGFLDAPELIPWFVIVAELAFGMIEPTIRALVADVTEPENRQAAYSLTYLGHNIGFAVGPLIAGYFFHRSTQILFLGDAATTVIAAVLIGLFITETRPDGEELDRIGRRQPKEKAETGSILGVLRRRPLLFWFMIANLALTFVYAQYTFSLPLQLDAIFGEAGAEWYGLTMTVNALTVVFFTAVLISATRKIRPIYVVAISALLYAVGFGSIGLFRRVLPLLAVTLVWTAGEILSATNLDVYIVNHTPANHRGRMNALTPILVGAGFAFSPALTGELIDAHGLSVVWPLAGLISVVAAGALFVLGRVEERRPSPA